MVFFSESGLISLPMIISMNNRNRLQRAILPCPTQFSASDAFLRFDRLVSQFSSSQQKTALEISASHLPRRHCDFPAHYLHTAIARPLLSFSVLYLPGHRRTWVWSVHPTCLSMLGGKACRGAMVIFSCLCGRRQIGVESLSLAHCLKKIGPW